MFHLESKNRPLALQQVKYWHTNVRVCLEDTNCLIVDRIVDGKGRVQQHYCPEGIQPTILSVLRVKISYNYCPDGIQPTNYLSWGTKYHTVIVQRVSNQPIICLEGQNIIQLLSSGYPTNQLSVLRVKISYSYCPEGIQPTNYVLRVKISYSYCPEGIQPTNYVLRVKISYNYCPEGIQPTNYLSWGSKYHTIIVQRVSN